MRSRPDPDRLRVALLSYRGNPACGGQGVYVRHLASGLVELGHEVTVFSGPPYPLLDDGPSLVRVPSLDLYREPDPFRIPSRSELHSWIDVAEVGIMCSGGFPEPRTFSWRVARLLEPLRSSFDVVHDNQSLGGGLLELVRSGWPVLGTIHHPITVDRAIELSHAGSWRRRVSLARWYGFVAMQRRVARRLERIITVSKSSRSDIVEQLGVARERLAVVPVGVDLGTFAPRPGTRRVPSRIMTTASADVPMKGLLPLLEALFLLRRTRPDAHLVVIGRIRADSSISASIERLGLAGVVQFVAGVSDAELVERYAEASVAVVPSLYEGFSLPAIEAMACEVPLVATTGGALPEVVGPSGGAALLVAPGDGGALAAAIGQVMDEPELGARLGVAGRARVLERFSWQRTAAGTAEQYRALLAQGAPGAAPPAEAVATSC